MSEESTSEKLEGVARDSLEVRFCLEIRGCPRCGGRALGVEELDTWRDRDDRQVGCYHLQCPSCGLRRKVEFFRGPGFDESHPRGHLGGPEPSSILEPHELVHELHRDLEELTESFRTVPATGEWGHLLNLAQKCITELPKFADPLDVEGDDIPEHYFRTESAKAARAAHPEWFRRPYFAELRARYDAMVAAADREVARRDAAGEVSAPLPPLVAPFSRASITLHAAWLGDKPGGQRLQVTGVDATGRHVSAVDLTGATFTDVTLDRADLSFTRFHGATFTNVRARGAGCESTMLAGTTLTHCNFTAAGMPIARLGDSTIDDCTFAGADLQRTSWYRAKVARTSLADTTLTDAALDSAEFTDCDFRGADLGIVKEGLLGTAMDAVFVRCDLRNTNWQGRALFRVRFIDCKLAGARGAARPEEVVIERPDLSAAGDGSQIGTERDVFALWGFDPAAPPPAPPPPKYRTLVYDVTHDEGDYLENFLRVKGVPSTKDLFRSGTELRFKVTFRDPIDAPLAPLVESQLAKYRAIRAYQDANPDQYFNPDGSPKLYAQLVAEDALDHAEERGESFDDIVQRLVRAGFTIEQAHEAIIDPSKARTE